MSSYTYSINGNFTSTGVIDFAEFDHRLEQIFPSNSSFVTVNGDDVTITFSTPLSSEDITVLNNAISTYTNIYPEIYPTPIFQINGDISGDGVILQKESDTLVSRDTIDTLTNKTISGTSNYVEANSLRNGSEWIVSMSGQAPLNRRVLTYDGSSASWESNFIKKYLILSPSTYSDGTASQASTTVLGFGTTFTNEMVGGIIVFSDDTYAFITAVIDATTLSVAQNQDVTESSYTIYYGGLQSDNSANTNIKDLTITNTLNTQGSILGPTIDNINYDISLRALLSDNRFSTKNLIVVKSTDAGIGEFTSISDAISTITDADVNNPYLIMVGPGVYTEPLLTLPSFVSLTGATINTTLIQPDGDHDIIVLNLRSELSYVTLQNAPMGYCGILSVDTDYSQVHKVSIYNCDTAVKIQSITQDAVCYLEYVDINEEYTHGIYVESQNGFLAKVNAENFYAFPTVNYILQNHIYGTGTNYELDVHVGFILGIGFEDGVKVHNGGKCTLNAYQINRCSRGIYIENETLLSVSGTTIDMCYIAILVGSPGLPPHLNANGVILMDNTRDLQINNLDTTGSFSGTIDYRKSFSNILTAFPINLRNNTSLYVENSGGDFRTISSALEYVNITVTGTTVNGSNIITSDEGNFTPIMTFLEVLGSTIPASTIATYIDDYTIQLSNLAEGDDTIQLTFLRPSSQNPFVIKVGIGTFIESELIIPKYVTLQGANSSSTIISVADSSQTYLVKLSSGSHIRSVTLNGSEVQNQDSIPLVICTGGSQGSISIEDCTMTNANIAIYIDASYESIPYFYIKNITAYECMKDIYIDGSIQTCGPNTIKGTISNYYSTNFIITSDYSTKIFGPNATIDFNNVQLIANTGLDGTAIDISDGSNVSINNIMIKGWDVGLTSTGTSNGTIININGGAFYECNRNIQIDDPNTTGSYIGNSTLQKVFVHPNANFSILERNTNMLTVAKNGGDYTSLAQALNSINPTILCTLEDGSTTITSLGLFTAIIDGSMVHGTGIVDPSYCTYIDDNTITVSNLVTITGSSNLLFERSEHNKLFVVRVSAGVFEEDTLNIPPYVSVIGISKNSTIIKPVDPNATFITLGKKSSIFHCSIHNVTDGIAILIDSLPGHATHDGSHNAAIIQDCIFHDCDVAIKLISTTAKSEAFIRNTKIGGNCTTGILVDGTISNTVDIARLNISDLCFIVTTDNSTCISASGPNCQLVCTNICTDYKDAVYCGLLISDGAKVNLANAVFESASIGILVPNIGLGPILTISNVTFRDSIIYAINITHPSTTGIITGIMRRAKVYINPESLVSANYSDIDEISTTIAGGLYLGKNNSTSTNVLDLINSGSTMGLLYGGKITHNTGLTIFIEGGVGYLASGIYPNNILSKVSWGDTQITLAPSLTNYIYVNSLIVVVPTPSRPNPTQNIILGKVRTDSTTVEFIDTSYVNSLHGVNSIDTYNREVFGAIFASGSIVTINSNRQMAVSSGKYYLAGTVFNPSGHSSPTPFSVYYHNNGVFKKNNNITVLDHTQYDNGFNLVALSPGYYAKHSVYLVGEGVNEKYMVVYGIDQYTLISDAQAAPLPLPPPYFNEGVVIIASVIVSQANPTYSSVRSERPLPSFNASTISLSIYHGSLLGLLEDDHPQYLKIDGSRAMNSNLDIANNSIINVSMINNVDISTHGSRHLPNGADPLLSAAPIGISGNVTTNSVGTANSFARSDHIHVIDQATLDRNAIGGAAALSVTRGGTGVNTLTNGNFLIGSGSFSINTNKSAPSGDVVGTSDVQTLSNKTITDSGSMIIGFPKLGNAVAVDALFGNDATGFRGGLPFKTIGAALSAALVGDEILVNPGVYNESSLMIPNGATIRGFDTQTTIINAIVSTSTTLVTMGSNCRLEDLTLRLTSSTPNITLTGVLFPGATTLTSTLKSVTLLVNNTTSSNATIYGVRANGSSSTSTVAQTLILSGVVTLATLATSGNIRAMYIDGACSLYAITSQLTAIGGANVSAVGCETTNAASVFNMKFGICMGTTSDILQTAGNIYFRLVELSSTSISISTPANQLMLGNNATPTTINSNASASRTLTLPDITDTLITKNSTDVLTNKTLTNPIISTILNTGILTLPTTTTTIVGTDTTNIFTNKLLHNNSNFFVDPTDNTKRIAFNSTNANANTTLTLIGNQTTNRSITFPDVSDTVATLTLAQTLTNKTLTNPIISNIVNVGTLTLPNSTDTLVARNTVDTLTNKTLTNPSISTIINTGTLTLPSSTDTLLARNTLDTLTNKTITGTTNTVDANNLRNGNTWIVPLTGGAPSNGQSLTYVGTSAVWSSGSIRSYSTMSPFTYSTGTVSQTGTTITGTGTTFTTSMLGGIIVFNSGQGVFITGYISPTTMTVAQNQSISSTTYTIYYGGFQADNSGNTSLSFLHNAKLVDNSNFLVNYVDNTKRINFDINNATSSTTLTLNTIQTANRVITFPDITDTLVTLTANQTLTNKTLTNPVIANITNVGTLILPTSNTTLIGNDTSDKLTNKNLSNLNVYHVDDTDITKRIAFASLTAATGTTLTLSASQSANRTITFPDITDTVVTLSATQTLSNKTLDNPSISTISNSGILTLPTATTTLIGHDTINQLSNKTLLNSTIFNVDDSDITKRLTFTTSGATTGTTLTIATIQTANRTITLPDISDTLVSLNSIQTLSNKTLQAPIISTISNTGTLTLPTSNTTLIGRDTVDTLTNKSLSTANVQFIDNIDNTKRLKFSTLGATTGTTLTLASIQTTNRTITYPDISDTLVTLSAPQTLTNKDLSSTTNIILALPKAGNVIYVDVIYGNNTLATRGGLPFLTVSAALTVAQYGDTIFLNPGIYNENNLILPNGTCLRGYSTNSTVINAVVTTSSTVLTMGIDCVFENIKLQITSSTPGISITGILFPNTSSINSQVKRCTITITNSTTSNATIYGIRSNGTGAQNLSYFTCLASCTININVLNAITGNARAIIVDGPNSFYGKDLTSAVIGLSGISSVVLETNHSNASLYIINATIRGSTADYLKTAGTLNLTSIDLSDGTIFSNLGNKIHLGSGSNMTTLTTTATTPRIITLFDATDTIVGLITPATLSNKNFLNSTVYQVDDTDNTKAIRFNTSGAVTGTTLTLNGVQSINRTITFPDISDTLVSLTSTQTLTNKTLTSPIINNIINTGTLTLPTTSTTLIGTNTINLLTNKTLNNSSVAFVDNIDNTKRILFNTFAATTATSLTLSSNQSVNRVITFPDISDTLVTLAATQTLTNKTFTNPIISTITNTGTLTLPTVSTTLIGNDTSDLLSNKSLNTANNYFVDNSDNSKRIGFNNSSSTTGTTLTLLGTQTANRSITFPDISDTVTTLTANQTLTNKLLATSTINAANVLFIDNNDSSKSLQFNISGAATITKLTLNSAQSQNRTITFPDITDTLVTLTANQTLTNKTLTNPIISAITNTGTVTLPTTTTTLIGNNTQDLLSNKSLLSSTFFVDNTDNTKKIGFITNGATTGTTLSLIGIQTQNRSITFPDITDTLVSLTASQTLTNKTLTSPTISTIVNTGTLTLPTTTDNLVARTTTDTLTNKTLTSSTNLILAYLKLGGVLIVDSINGNNGIATRGGLPFSTIAAALASAQTGDTVWIMPGTYAENGLIMPSGIAMRGINVQTSRISSTVTTNTTLLTMANNCRVEDLTLSMTSNTSGLILQGIVFGGTTAIDAKFRTSVLNITNTTTGSVTIYTIRSNGTGNAPSTEAQAVRASTITANAVNATSGVVRAAYVDSASTIYTRDSNFVAVGSAGVSAIGIETNHMSASFQLRSGTSKGTTIDYLQSWGSIIFTGVDLTNGSAYTQPANQLILGNLFTTTINAASTSNVTITTPDSTGVLVTKTSTDVLANKSLSNNSVTFIDSTDNTKKIGFATNSATTGTTLTLAGVQTTNRTITFPDITDTLVTLTSNQQLTNKSLNNSNTFHIDNVDVTKRIAFSSFGATTGTTLTLNAIQSTNRTISFPDITDTVVTLNSIQNLTNKNLNNASTYFIDNVDNTKRIAFTSNGASSGSTLTLNAIQTANRNITFPDISDTVLTLNASQVLTNKSITGTTNTVDANNLRNSNVWTIALGGPSPSPGSVLTFNGLVASWTSSISQATTYLALSPFTYNTGTVSQSGTLITGVGTSFTSAMLGGIIIYSSGQSVFITRFNSPTSLETKQSLTIASSTYILYYGGFQTDTMGNTSVGSLYNSNLIDTSISIANDLDNTKKILYSVGGSTGTSTTLTSSQTANRIITYPDITDTLVSLSATQTLSNKTLPFLNVTGNLSSVALAGVGAQTRIAPAIITDTSSAASSTVLWNNLNSFAQSTFAATNTAVTYSRASTMYIAGPPLAGTNVSITNPYSLYINSGLAYINANLSINHLIGNTAVPTVVAGTGVGITRSATVDGNDMCGRITVNSGSTGLGNSAIVTLTFAIPYTLAPKVVITPGNALTAEPPNNGTPFLSTTTTTNFVISTNTAAIGTGTFVWWYMVMQ